LQASLRSSGVMLKKAMAGNGTKNSSQRTDIIEYLIGFILFPMGPGDLICGETHVAFENL
jgi:hypothetical protein